MPRFTLTALDVASIQRYIFGSNRLQENVGASELVYRATHQWAFGELPTPNNLVDVQTGELDPSRRIEDLEQGLASELVYAGGGNTVILFASLEEARSFVTRLSKTLIVAAPDLDLVAAHTPMDWENQPFGDLERGAIRAVMDELDRVKRCRFATAPLLGLGVTAACQSTGLVAVKRHPKGFPISAAVSAKWDRAGPALDRLVNQLPQIQAEGLEVPLDFDEFGRSKDKSSYIAVVHADGNGMGQRVRAIAGDHTRAGDGNREYIDAMRGFSAKVERASQAALSDMVSTLLASISENRRSIAREVPIRDLKIPFRPLVFGGDDLTFVCDGRLGLPLAASYLEAFERRTAQDGIPSFACAGISVVKTHYPFARAYGLAEQLCHSAKQSVRSQQTEQDYSALDWHFAVTGLAGALSEIREREYELPGGQSLLMRPVRLRREVTTWRTWGNFRSVTEAFKGEGWSKKRNKVMKLRSALRKGQRGVEYFLSAYEDVKELPEMKQLPAVARRSGWDSDICAYFDPIEAMDFFASLGPERRG